MDSKENKSHIGGPDLFGGTEPTAEEKIAAAEAALTEARAEMAAGGKIAGDARTADDERRRVEGVVLRGDPEHKLTAYEELGSQVSDPETNVTIEHIHQSQADAAEAARAKVQRLERDKLNNAQKAVNAEGFPPVKEALGDKHPTRGESNIAASQGHIRDEEKWKEIIALGRDGEPVEPPMKTADTVPEAEARLNEIIAKRDETTN